MATKYRLTVTVLAHEDRTPHEMELDVKDALRLYGYTVAVVEKVSKARV